MNCNVVRNLLSAYVDSELSGNQMLAIRSHVSLCDECRVELDQLKAVKTGLSLLAEHQPDPMMAKRIVAKATSQSQGQLSGRSVLTLAAAAAAAAVLAMVVFNLSTGRTDKANLAKDDQTFDSQADQAVTMPDFGGHAPIIPVSK